MIEAAFLLFFLGEVRAKDEDRAPREAGLREGDRFTVELEYSNSWEEKWILPQRALPGPRPRESADLLSAARRVEGAAMANDPLWMKLELDVEVRKERSFSLTPRIERVRSGGGRGSGWILERGRRDFKTLATKRLIAAAAEWRYQFANRLEREMLEEQLLAAALAHLHGVPVETEMDLRADARFPALHQLLAARLPPAYPPALYEQVEWFLREAAARALHPPVVVLGKDARYEWRGLPYRVTGGSRQGGRELAAVTGELHQQAPGLAVRDHMTVDVATGLVVEGKTTVVRDAVYLGHLRFGVVRWQATLGRYRPADPAGPEDENLGAGR